MQKTAQQFKDEGNVAFKAKDYQKAIDLYTKAIEQDQSQPSYYSNRSVCYFNLRKYEEALKDAQESTQIDPNFQRGYERQINVLQKLNKIEEAKKLVKESLEKFPESEKFKKLEAGLNKPAFDMNSMLQNPMIQQLIKENPQLVQQLMQNPSLLQNPQMMNMLMQMYQKKAQQQTGQQPGQQQQNSQFTNQQFNPQSQQTPTQTTPKNPQTNTKEEEPQQNNAFLTTKAEANKLYMKKQFNEAINLYDKCHELDPLNLIALNNKAACQIELKKLDEALQTLEKAITIYKDCDYEKRSYEHYAKVLARKGRIYHLQKEFEKSIEAYSDSLMENQVPKVSATLRQVKRDKQKMEQEAYVNVELSEQHRQQGNEFYKTQKYPEALKEYEEALKRNPSDTKVLGNLSAVFIKLMNFNEAMKYCDKVLESDPSNVKAMNRKGQIYNFRKEYHKAMDTYKEVLKLKPDDAKAKQGIYNTQQKISMGNIQGQDEERIKRAMQDPEIVAIMQDPMVRIALEQMKNDPKKVMECMQDPNLAPKIERLMHAGILMTK